MAELAVALLALFAHLERVFLHQRAAHARDTAATHDKQPGRPRKLNPHQLAAARAALAANQSVEHVAAAFGVSRATLYHHLTQHNNQQTAHRPAPIRSFAAGDSFLPDTPTPRCGCQRSCRPSVSDCRRTWG